VCKVDCEGVGDEGGDIGEGECILLLQDGNANANANGNAGGQGQNGGGPGFSFSTEGINAIVALDDNLIWTASGSSTIKRWRVPQKRSVRANALRSPSVGSLGDTLSLAHTHSGHPPSPSWNGTPQASSPGAGALERHRSQASLTPSLHSLHSLHSSNNPSTSSFSVPMPVVTAGALPSPPLPPSQTGWMPYRQCEEENVTLYGIPYESLIKLASLNDPFGVVGGLGVAGASRVGVNSMGAGAGAFGGYGPGAYGPGASGGGASVLPMGTMRRRRDDEEVATVYSATGSHRRSHSNSQASHGQQQLSLASPPPLQSGRTDDTIHTFNTSQSRPISAVTVSHSAAASHYPLSSTTLADPHTNPKLSYESRDIASEALPLLSAPESVIRGERGLVRSVVLNDRTNVLTVDTEGEVAVWDLVRGKMRGIWGREEILRELGRSGTGPGLDSGGSRSHTTTEEDRSPREALERVRERIEGEAVITPWCSADTKSGVLAIHLDGRQCFDAEVYADEVGFAPRDGSRAEEVKSECLWHR
jgi:WD repeat-containing protein 48